MVKKKIIGARNRMGMRTTVRCSSRPLTTPTGSIRIVATKSDRMKVKNDVRVHGKEFRARS